MATRYFEPTIPIKNKELFDLVEELRVRDLRRLGLNYSSGHSLNADSIVLEGYGYNISFRNHEDEFPIAVYGVSSNQIIKELSELLKMDFMESKPEDRR